MFIRFASMFKTFCLSYHPLKMGEFYRHDYINCKQIEVTT